MTDENIVEENKNASVSDLSIDDLTQEETLPEANESAIAAVQKSEQEEKEELQRQEQENIRYNKDGSIAKKRGRKAGQKPLNKNDSSLFVGSDAQLKERKSLPAAITVSGLLESAQVTLISKDFVYTDLERKQNVEAWEKLMDRYGGMEIHPAAEVAMNHFSIIASRAASSEETKTKLSHFRIWFASKISRLKKGKKDALSGSGQDVERENNVRGKEK